MNTSLKFKDYTPLQKTGYILLIIASAMKLAKMLNILETNHFIKDDLPNYMFGIGGILILLPHVSKWINGTNISKKTTIFILAVCTSLGAIAQDYSKQIKAFENSFSQKSVTPLEEHVSPELKFDPIPVANTPAILTNIVSKLPKLNSMTILEHSKGEAKVKYDFVGLGVRESSIHFNEEGKITRIELIENLIQQELKAQQKIKESVQQPQMTEAAKKHQPIAMEFKSLDGLLISGNLYEIDENKPVILLCHQAGYNKMEYADIAPKLNEMGYNCLAIDQRSGGDFAGKPNETFQRAKEKGLPTEYVDAQQDIEAAIDLLYKKYNKKILIWGSSYSSSLVLFESLKNKNVSASISFSPGDYFGDKKPSLSTVFSKIKKPYFITSSKQEAATLSALIANKQLKENQLQFIPELDGFHGSKALWEGQKGADVYWNAIKQFLNTISKSKRK